jgi:hypothetical protein
MGTICARRGACRTEAAPRATRTMGKATHLFDARVPRMGCGASQGDDDLDVPLDELSDGTFSPPHLRRSPTRRNSAIIAMRMESQLQRVDGDGEARAAPTV